MDSYNISQGQSDTRSPQSPDPLIDKLNNALDFIDAKAYKKLTQEMGAIDCFVPHEQQNEAKNVEESQFDSQDMNITDGWTKSNMYWENMYRQQVKLIFLQQFCMIKP